MKTIFRTKKLDKAFKTAAALMKGETYIQV